MGEPGSYALTNAPFPAAPLWAPGPDGSFWYADSRAYRLLRIGFAGDTLVDLSVPVEGEPVSDADWDRFVVGPAGDPSTPAARARAVLSRPERRPVLGGLLGTPDGDVWVRLRSGQEGGAEWHVYDRQGEPRFRLHLPEGEDLRAVGPGVLATVSTDAFGVQRLNLYDLAR